MRKTKAELNAEAARRLAVQYGFTAEVKVEVDPAKMFTSGGVMIPERTHVWLTLRDAELLITGEYAHVGWVTFGESKYGHAGTRFMGGEVSRVFVPKNQRTKRFRRVGQFRKWLRSYSYRLQPNEDVRINEEFAESAASAERDMTP